jgi:hypothetical protein
VTEQLRLTAFLRIACWEMIFGPGDGALWQRVIADLLARGATL